MRPGEWASVSGTLSDINDLAVVQREVAIVGCVSSSIRLSMTNNIRGGTETVSTRFAGGKLKTGRDGKKFKTMVYSIRLDRAVGVEFSRRDGTIQINYYFFHDWPGRLISQFKTGRDGNRFSPDRTERTMHIIVPRRDRTVLCFSARDGTVLFCFYRWDGTISFFSRREMMCLFVHLDMPCFTEPTRAAQVWAVSSAASEARSRHCEW